MKKILKGLLCATAVVSMAFANVQGVFAADTASYEITTDKATLKANDEFVVTVNVKNNSGINAVTGALTYDKDLIQPVSAVDASNPAFTIMTTSDLNTQIGLKPSATNADYAGLGADGTKTAGELGKIKVAGYLTSGNDLIQSSNNGAIFSVKFKTIKTDSKATNIKFENIKTSGYENGEIPTREVANANLSLAFEGGSTTDPVNPNPDKPNPDEPNPDKPNPDTPATTYTHLKGDVDHSGKIGTNDAAQIIKEALAPVKVTATDADLAKIYDVDGENGVTTADAALVIKMAIAPTGSYTFPGGNEVQVSKKYEAVNQ